METSPLDDLFDKLACRDALAEDERLALLDRMEPGAHYRAGSDLVREGDRPNRSTLLVSGLATRYRVLSHGQRQITAIHIPGDFVDLHSLLIKTMDHSVGALTDCDVVVFPHTRLVEITERYPHLTRLLWLSTLLDGAIHREWLVAMGRRPSAQQMAHLICEFYLRLSVVHRVEDMTFTLPLTQIELGDVLGMSAVHVNRVLQGLRAENLFTWEGQTIRILDWPALQRRAEFDPTYLHLVRQPR